jgi:hypothetical protein
MEMKNGIPNPVNPLTTQPDAELREPQKIRYGAPNGPRRTERENLDRREPIPYPGHEAVAQYLAAPDSERQFRSVQELADHFHVTRKTIYAWRKDEFVLKRVEWLTQQNKLHGTSSLVGHGRKSWKVPWRRQKPAMSQP